MPSLMICIRASHAQERVEDGSWGHATPGSHKEGKAKGGGLRNRELCRMWRPDQVTTESGKQRDTGIGREGDLEAAGGKHPHFPVNP